MTFAIVGLAMAALGMATVAILAERKSGDSRVRTAEIKAALQVVTVERDEALGDVERLQRRADALDEFARDQIARLGGMLDADGVDLLLAELAIVADPRGRPIATATCSGVPGPGSATPAGRRDSDAPTNAGLPGGGPA